MWYTLWSRGRLLGYTELDLPHVQEHIRMGFIEPTPEGVRLLPDAMIGRRLRDIQAWQPPKAHASGGAR